VHELVAHVLSMDSPNFGHTSTVWTVRWWRWLLSIPRTENPAHDPTGKNSSLFQEYGDVFFLCQTMGNSESCIFRKATVPSGKVLFMPIINWISVSGVDGETPTELSLVAKNKIDAVTDLELKINGKAVEGLYKYRVRSPLFEIKLPENNILGDFRGRRLCVSDGYWIFLKPVKKNITLSSFGACSSGLNRIGVNYQLLIP
jgi:hypothetical protein